MIGHLSVMWTPPQTLLLCRHRRGREQSEQNMPALGQLLVAYRAWVKKQKQSLEKIQYYKNLGFTFTDIEDRFVAKVTKFVLVLIRRCGSIVAKN